MHPPAVYGKHTGIKCHLLMVNLRSSQCQPPWFTVSTSVVHRVNLRGSPCHPPWFILSTSVVHRVTLRGSCCHPPWFIVSTSVVHDVFRMGLYYNNVLKRSWATNSAYIQICRPIYLCLQCLIILQLLPAPQRVLQ